MQINSSAPVKCSLEIEILSPPWKVWSVMTDINNWSKWQPDITHPKIKEPLKQGLQFTWRTGGAGITSIIHTLQPPDQLGWTGKTFGMYAIHNWTFKHTAAGTLVSVEESMEGTLARILKGMFNKNLKRDMGNWLKYLKEECEK